MSNSLPQYHGTGKVDEETCDHGGERGPATFRKNAEGLAGKRI
jgi:hypothetical protein